MYSAGHNEAGSRRVDLAIDNAVPSSFPEVEIVKRRFVHEGPDILRDTSAWTQPDEEQDQKSMSRGHEGTPRA
jgi:hypothetical protein